MARSTKHETLILGLLEEETRLIRERIHFCEQLLERLPEEAGTAKAIGAAKATAATPDRAGRFLSPAARRRIGAAQKKRWKEHRAKAKAAAKNEELSRLMATPLQKGKNKNAAAD